jgi:hypothetical protein
VLPGHTRQGIVSCAILRAAHRLARLGATGRISRVWRGTVQDVLTGLPSLAGEGGNFATGPYDVSFQGRGNGFAVIGLGRTVRKRLWRFRAL